MMRPSNVLRSAVGAVTTSFFIWLTVRVRALTAESLAFFSM